MWHLSCIWHTANILAWKVHWFINLQTILCYYTQNKEIMPINCATENQGLSSLSAYWFILLQSLLAYIKQSGLPLAPSFTLAGLCQALLLVVPSASYWIYQAPISATCCLLQPLWPVIQPQLLVVVSFSLPWHASSSQKCFLLPPSASLTYAKQPNLLISFSLFWPVSGSGQQEDNTVIISTDKRECTNPYSDKELALPSTQSCVSKS